MSLTNAVPSISMEVSHDRQMRAGLEPYALTSA